MPTPIQLYRAQHGEAVTTLDNWQQVLTAVAAYHETAARRRWIYRTLVVLASPGMLVFLVVLFRVVSPVVGLLAIFWLIVMGVWRRKSVFVRSVLSVRGQATPRHRLRVVRALLAVLRADMGAAEPLRLSLDLRDATVKAKQIPARPPAGGRRRPAPITETWYADPWLSGATRLIDGSALSWRVVEHIRHRKVTRKNPRGKTKRKTKYKMKRCIDVRLDVRQDRSTPLPAPPATQDRLRVRSGGKWHVVHVRRVITTETLEVPPQVRDVLDLIAQAYRRVTPPRGRGQA